MSAVSARELQKALMNAVRGVYHAGDDVVLWKAESTASPANFASRWPTWPMTKPESLTSSHNVARASTIRALSQALGRPQIMSSWSATLTALAPLLGALVPSLVTFGRRRRLQGHIELRKNLPESGHAAIDELINLEVADLVARSKRRLNRKVDGGTVAAIVVLAVVAGCGAWLLWQVDHVIADLGAIVLGVIGFLFVAVGFSQLYVDKSESESK